MSFALIPAEAKKRCEDQIAVMACTDPGEHLFMGPVTCQLDHGNGDDRLTFHHCYICEHCRAQVCDFADRFREIGC